MTIFGELVFAAAQKVGVSYDAFIIYLVLGVIILALIMIANANYIPIKPEHKRNIKESKKLHRQIQRADDNAFRMKLMRDTHPNIFEELLLTSLKSPRRKIKRNHRYTGDGGMDGKVRINGQWHLIQAKRYKNHIDASHVEEFVRLCRKEGCPGLFIHTGRTGEKSRDIIRGADNCTMISGQALCAMVAGDVKIERLLNEDL